MDKEQNKSQAAEREEKVLTFWKENNIFEKSLEKESPKGEFVFYEGPPTANGKPGIHHVEARSFKDAIPRYKTMQGFHVRRKGGWDTHGLPVELQVEKALGLKSKKEIESYGVAEFNKKCKDSVGEYLDIWGKFTDRIGYWVDQKNAYFTYHNSYIESLWNVLSQVNDKGLLYKDYKVVPWCPRCGTALSSHELAQGYEDVKDLSVYVKFKVKNPEKIGLSGNVYLVAWTTTPWTLPGNVGLAVGEDIKYDLIQDPTNSEMYIIAKELNGFDIYKTNNELVILDKTYLGSDLVGLEYEPLFTELRDFMESSELKKQKYSNYKNGWKVYAAKFVTNTDGTGIVHTAVMYGQEDFELGTKYNLPKLHTVDENGHFISGVVPEFLNDRFVKEKDEKGKPTVDVAIIDALKLKKYFFNQETYKHSYPHCWRCKTPLIYYARDSWYIRMSSLRSELMKENESINWEPAHTREGRFGEWLREVKDWAISRERYWGTPLPIWTTETGKMKVVSSVEDLKKHAKRSGNNYFVMRHGQASNNIGELYTVDPTQSFKLTEEGRSQVLKSVESISETIDVVVCSPYERTKETAEIVCNKLGFDSTKVVYDDRVREWEVSNEFSGKSREIMKQFYDTDYLHNSSKKFIDGESFAEVVKRAGEFIYDIDSKYSGKNIFIVTHSGLMRALAFVAEGTEFSELPQANNVVSLPDNAEIRKLDFVPLPHNEHFELDLHKPFIDDIKLVDEDGEEMTRVKEVMDVWFDSGAMPYAQDHYPFENKEWVDGPGYPADFISEAIDQTRGWFYTLHAVGVLLGRGKAYKNVICLGHILDANGKKMSKSLGNIVDPWVMIDKYGVDTLRMWMYSVNQPGDSKNFDEKTVAELHNKVFNLYYNVLSFYELYRDKDLEKNDVTDSSNVLDQWILARLNQLITLSTTSIDIYKLFEPARAIREFMDDLSTWYLRRSRDRLKDGDKEAKQTLYFVLKTVSKILAPFAPFTAEDVWQKLKNDKDEMSVHLTAWPEALEINESVLTEMNIVRDVCTAGNAERKKLNIPVRQPLQKITTKQKVETAYADLIKDELNVKEVVANTELAAEVELDTNITPELKQEGDYRELVRAVQDLRKKMDLTPSDRITISLSGSAEELVRKFMSDFQKTVQADEVSYDATEGEEVKVGEQNFTVKIAKN